jgi:hypothetical protein
VTRFAVTTIRTVSIGLCLIAALSFLLFAVNQTSTASGKQQEALSGTSAQSEAKAAHKPATESGFRRTIDEISEEVSAPVAGVSSSQWGERTLRLFFVLLVFGFALGFLARLIRVRS